MRRYNLTIFKHAILWTRQATHIVEHAKHANFLKHAKHSIS